MVAPAVAAHRITRMALAGPKPSKRDRREFERMVSEKHAAIVRAWGDMVVEAFRVNQAATAVTLRCLFTPFAPRNRAAATRVQRAATEVLGKGLAPVHRKAVSNFRRLAKTKLR